ncbi:group II intron maturase-specific domain-containing protein [Falcatimonas sp. MSJ-15]|uniref:group II intron maturase-specific domain-containing protein n=1 Tax=Falcatimonas sp. MSJ-15 TaxID=2841515 RepID=UPI00209DBFE9|nr:group II intron maturase-specific domain-containing protein [Falcatimonas sp. MSJ-15]
MKILDLDMDYFMENIATGIAESREERLAEDEYGDCVWSEYRIRKFLEDNLGLSNEKKIKGRIVTGHNEALFFWQIKVYARGWLNYYEIASMKNNIDDICNINGWLYHRIRMSIWKQWKKPRTKVRNLIKMGVPEDLAMQAGNTRRGYWFATHTIAVNMAMTKERLINSGFYDLATIYQSVHVNY